MKWNDMIWNFIKLKWVRQECTHHPHFIRGPPVLKFNQRKNVSSRLLLNFAFVDKVTEQKKNLQNEHEHTTIIWIFDMLLLKRVKLFKKKNSTIPHAFVLWICFLIMIISICKHYSKKYISQIWRTCHFHWKVPVSLNSFKIFEYISWQRIKHLRKNLFIQFYQHFFLLL